MPPKKNFLYPTVSRGKRLFKKWNFTILVFLGTLKVHLQFIIFFPSNNKAFYRHQFFCVPSKNRKTHFRLKRLKLEKLTSNFKEYSSFPKSEKTNLQFLIFCRQIMMYLFHTESYNMISSSSLVSISNRSPANSKIRKMFKAPRSTWKIWNT